jgi:hypothetical protein
MRCNNSFEPNDVQNGPPPLQNHAPSGDTVHRVFDYGIGKHAQSTFSSVPADSAAASLSQNHANGTMHMFEPQSQSFTYLNQANPIDLPHRQTTGLTPNMGGTVTSLSPSSNEMDTEAHPNNDQATPSTTISRQNSTSHTSYNTPPNIDPSLDKTNAFASAFNNNGNGGSINNNTNPITTTTASSTAMPMGSTATTATTGTDGAFFAVTDDMDFNLHHNFSMATGHTPAHMSGEEFSFPPGWDISMGGAGAGSGTGLTPIAETSWTSMMDGWEGMGPPHADVFGRRV